MGLLDAKKVPVTGAGDGVGWECALAAALEGARISPTTLARHCVRLWRRIDPAGGRLCVPSSSGSALIDRAVATNGTSVACCAGELRLWVTT